MDVSEDWCSVCLESFTNQEVTTTEACHHTFHKNCLYKHLRKNQNCPLCRNELPKPPPSKRLLVTNMLMFNERGEFMFADSYQWKQINDALDDLYEDEEPEPDVLRSLFFRFAPHNK
jgi:E3 ubiquitin-protein ligase RHF